MSGSSWNFGLRREGQYSASLSASDCVCLGQMWIFYLGSDALHSKGLPIYSLVPKGLDQLGLMASHDQLRITLQALVIETGTF